MPQIDLHTITDEAFNVGNTTIVPLPIMHYKLPILGFRIGDFTYVTDAKTIADETLEKIKGTRILVVNALQREQHISHFTLDEAIEFSEKVGAETTYFTHISHNLGLHAVVEKDLPANIKLAYDGLTILSE